MAYGLCCVAGLPTVGTSQESSNTPPEVERQGFLVDVDLPLVGQRDELVRRQIESIGDANSDQERRPVVVLRFKATPLSEMGGEPDNGGLGSRGSQFERCLALARFLTSPEAARVRLVAYVPENVEGHAILPILACEEIVAASNAEIGRASIDEPVDATVIGAYQDVVSRRATLPVPVVMAMLNPDSEVYELELTDGSLQVANRDDRQKLRDEGKVLGEKTVWLGGGLAQFSGQQLRSRRWIAATVNDPAELTEVLNLPGSLRTTRQLPRQWQPVMISIADNLSAARVNQIIRGLTTAIDSDETNMIVINLFQTECDFLQSTRLASFLADLDQDKVYTLGMINGNVPGPAALIAVACNETVLISDASIGPNLDQQPRDDGSLDTMWRVLGDLESVTNRPLPLLSVLADPTVLVNEYVNQESGKKAIFAEWQIAKQADANSWLEKQQVAGGEPIDSAVALRYRLVDSIDDSGSIALNRLGIEQMPPELSTPWLDASIQMLLAQPWLPRMLLTIGFFALMVELGNPGISAGGLLAGVCFLGFFWIEGLNGNVEWLEILLFIAGLVALAIELFVIPGFGLFGIGGLLMLLVSVVLASQTFVWPTTSAQLNEVAWNLFWVACLALSGMVGLLFMHKQLERSPVLRWVTLQPTSDDDLEDLDIRESIVHREHLLGQTGLTKTRLNPSGKAQFGRDVVAVVGTGKLISEGVPVRVVEVRGNLVLVEESDE
jgi:membrane-bound serine protease (ClpP class)